MKSWKTFTAVGLAVSAVITLSACGQVDENASNRFIEVSAVTFPDGSKTDCFVTGPQHTAGLECAWNETSTATTTNNRLIGSVENISGKTVRCVGIEGGHSSSIDCDLEARPEK